jgi:hypothetical protein
MKGRNKQSNKYVIKYLRSKKVGKKERTNSADKKLWK